jgi:16S rRNA processing protein RimM
VGRVVRPHGLRGETVVDFVSNRAERTRPGARYATDGGPLEVEEVRPFGDRWLVRFSGVGDRPGAEALRGTVLRATPIDDTDALWVHDLVGARAVRAGDGAVLGRVVSVLSNPASDLLELDGGALVPVRFVVARRPGELELDLPDGLLDQ